MPFTGLWLEAPAEALETRIAERTGDASDATVAVLRRQRIDFGTVGWHRVDAGGTPKADPGKGPAARGRPGPRLISPPVWPRTDATTRGKAHPIMPLKQSAWNWPAPRNFPRAARSTATNSWRRSTRTAISTWTNGRSSARPASSTASGTARTTSTASSSIPAAAGRFPTRPGEDDDESLFKFDRHIFKEGEYVGITEHDGVTRPFRVAWVRTPPALTKS